MAYNSFLYEVLALDLTKYCILYALNAHHSQTGGGGGIRTHVRLKSENGFQDRHLKPLGHPSKLLKYRQQNHQRSNIL